MTKEGTKEYRGENIAEMQAWPLDKKIEHAKKRIVEFYEEQNGKVYISFSGGKDSCVLDHLVTSIYPSVPKVFSNTTNEYIEIIRFVKSLENLIELKPKMSFKETVKKYGFPLVSKKVARQIHDIRNPTGNNDATIKLYLTGIKRDGTKSKDFKLARKWHSLIEAPFDITNKCCDILKKEPLARFEKETGLVPFVGTQASESSMRRSKWIETGCNTNDGKNTQSRPLSIWSEADVWEYIKRFNVSYSTIYDDVKDKDGKVVVKGEVRTGCAYCAFGAQFEKSDQERTNRFERLSIRKPHQHKKMMELENNGVKFSDALSFINIENKREI